MSDLDEQLARAQHTVSVLQRALYSPAPWTATCSGETVGVGMEQDDDGIVLLVSFEHARGGPVSIYCGDDLMLAYDRVECDCGCDGGFNLRWSISLRVPVAG